MIQSKTSIWTTNVYKDLYIVSNRLLIALESLCTTINPDPQQISVELQYCQCCFLWVESQMNLSQGNSRLHKVAISQEEYCMVTK